MAIVWDETAGHLYTTNQAEGALLNGTRVQKVNSEPEDGHGDGALGTVIGSLGHPSIPYLVYFVAWDEAPGAGLPVALIERRVKLWKEDCVSK